MLKNTLTSVIAVIAVSAATLMPAFAQKGPDKTMNEWKNIAIGSGIVGVLGLIKKDGTLTFVGTAGALYSLYRYEEDRKSRDRYRRLRASYFSKGSFTRDGHRYVRKTVVKNGKKYYQFVRVS